MSAWSRLTCCSRASDVGSHSEQRGHRNCSDSGNHKLERFSVRFQVEKSDIIVMPLNMRTFCSVTPPALAAALSLPIPTRPSAGLVRSKWILLKLYKITIWDHFVIIFFFKLERSKILDRILSYLVIWFNSAPVDVLLHLGGRRLLVRAHRARNLRLRRRRRRRGRFHVKGQFGPPTPRRKCSLLKEDFFHLVDVE